MIPVRLRGMSGLCQHSFISDEDKGQRLEIPCPYGLFLNLEASRLGPIEPGISANFARQRVIALSTELYPKGKAVGIEGVLRKPL